MLNPEFRRYLWTEMSLHKLVAVPVVLGAVFFLLETTGFSSGMAALSPAAFMVIAFLWGTRRAAAAVVEEVRGGTWDSQRMSTLDAWPMAWGKLFGSTIFSWYSGLICLGFFVAAALAKSGSEPTAQYVVELILSAMLMHAVALAASVAFLRKAQGEGQVSITLCHLIGLGVLALDRDFTRLLAGRPTPSDSFTYWHGYEVSEFSFTLAMLIVFYGWAVLAVYRLMRAELQHRTLPWGWAAFMLFLMAFACGFADERTSGLSFERLGTAFVVAVAMAYAVFLLENKNIIAVKAWIEAARTRQWFALVMATPSWLVCLGIAMAVGAAYSAWAATMYPSSPLGYLTGSAFRGWGTDIGMLFFMLRDIGFLLFMNLCTRLRRPDVAGVIYLAVLYGAGGGILDEANLDVALAFVIPNDTGNLFLTVAPPLAEAAAVWAYLVYRLRETLRVAAPAG